MLYMVTPQNLLLITPNRANLKIQLVKSNSIDLDMQTYCKLLTFQNSPRCRSQKFRGPGILILAGPFTKAHCEHAGYALEKVPAPLRVETTGHLNVGNRANEQDLELWWTPWEKVGNWWEWVGKR